jgi:hypothetical protein
MPIPNARNGQNVLLECGHCVHTFGNLTLAGGWLLCTECRDQRN